MKTQQQTIEDVVDEYGYHLCGEPIEIMDDFGQFNQYTFKNTSDHYFVFNVRTWVAGEEMLKEAIALEFQQQIVKNK